MYVPFLQVLSLLVSQLPPTFARDRAAVQHAQGYVDQYTRSTCPRGFYGAYSLDIDAWRGGAIRPSSDPNLGGQRWFREAGRCLRKGVCQYSAASRLEELDFNTKFLQPGAVSTYRDVVPWASSSGN